MLITINGEMTMTKSTTVKCRGNCGRTLKDEPDRDWYATSHGDKIISGICPECYRKEKQNRD